MRGKFPVLLTLPKMMHDAQIEVSGTFPDAEMDRLWMEAKEALRVLGKCGHYHFTFELNPKQPSELVIRVSAGTKQQVITVERDEWKKPEVITGALIDQLNI